MRLPNCAALSFAAVLAPLSASGQSVPLLTVEEVARRAIPATATIITLGEHGDTIAQGSGFVYRSNGVIVTNWHVMRGAFHARVALATGAQYDVVGVVVADSAADLAEIKIAATDLSTLRLTSSAPATGSRVVVIGSPLGFQQSVTEGVVSAVRSIDGSGWLQISAPISPGSSGGPVLNLTGQVIGVATATMRSGQNLNLAIPAAAVSRLHAETAAIRPLASVFALGPAATPPTAAGRAGYSPPAHTRNLRPRLAGAYDLQSSLFEAAAGEDFENIPPVVSGHKFGRMVATGYSAGCISFDGGSRFPASAENVFLRGSESGQVVLSMLDPTHSVELAYDGFQTDSGIHLSAQSRDSTSGRSSLYVIDASLVDWPLSNQSGVYQIETQLQTILAQQRREMRTFGPPFRGEAAVCVSGMTVDIALELRGGVGGRTEFFGGPIQPDGTFDLTGRSKQYPTTIKGRFSPGAFYAEYREQVERDIRIEGTLTARRQ